MIDVYKRQEQKYYFNPDFKMLPKSVKEELHILCVLYTEDVGGIFTIIFEPDGGVTLETTAAEEDFLYDEVSSGLLLGDNGAKYRCEIAHLGYRDLGGKLLHTLFLRSAPTCLLYTSRCV